MIEKIAFVFPGQGSQSVGMLSNLSKEPVFQKTFEEASKALGYDLQSLILEGPAEKLNQTEYTQPALLTASFALWRLWLLKGHSKPAFLAGHSLGEYTALLCADALSLADAVKLVALRGRLMQNAVKSGEGAMAAILGLENEIVRAVCEKAATLDEVVAPANYNSPGQVVISGHANAVARAIAEAKSLGAKRALPLPVSVPSHCVLMKPAALLLKEALEALPLQLPQIPVIHNVDVLVHPTVGEIKRVLVEQLYQPVRWVEIVKQMALNGVKTIYECGPGTVLCGLNKRIDASLQSESLTTALLSGINGEPACL